MKQLSLALNNLIRVDMPLNHSIQVISEPNRSVWNLLVYCVQTNDLLKRISNVISDYLKTIYLYANYLY